MSETQETADSRSPGGPATAGRQDGAFGALRASAGLVARLFACLLLVLSACTHKPEPLGLPATRPTVRTDVTLLDAALALRVGSADTARADDAPKQAQAGDTVWVFPVVRLVLGKQETLCLANTQHLGRVGRTADPDSGWNLAGRVSVWSRLKNDIDIEWYEVKPVKSYFRRNEPLRYQQVPLRTPRSAVRTPRPDDWFRELSGETGFRRLLVRVRYGMQSVTSSSPALEAEVARIPWVSFRQDTTWPGKLAGTLGAIPYRENSTREQTEQYVCCDSRSLIASGLAHIGYDIKSENGDRALDTLGKEIFSGYIQLGRLYDLRGRRSGFGAIQPGDVIHFQTLGSYAVVLNHPAIGGYRYGGLPARLPLLRAAHGSPEKVTLASALWSLRTLFGKSRLRVVRYEPIRNTLPVAGAKPRKVPSAPARKSRTKKK